MGLSLDYENASNMSASTLSNAPNGAPKISVNGTDTPDSDVPMSANDNIRRFEAPSRALSPQQHALFHGKTRCFV